MLVKAPLTCLALFLFNRLSIRWLGVSRPLNHTGKGVSDIPALEDTTSFKLVAFPNLNAFDKVDFASCEGSSEFDCFI